MDNSEQWFERGRAHFVGGVNSPVRAFGAVGGTPRVIERGKGSRITDMDGKSYIDYVMSWGALMLGHAHPFVMKAVKAAIERGTSFGVPTRLEVELAELIKDAFPSIEKLRFVSSGTEAVMTAIRLARGATGQRRIVKFSGCYHGHCDSLLVSAGSGLATAGVASSAGVPNELAELTLVSTYNDAAAFQKLMAQYGQEVAAVIVEPVAGNMGVVVPDEQFLVELRAEATRAGAILIFDEVITGFRLGWGGAEKRTSIKPDLTCLGKIIGGGFPVGAVGGRGEIMENLAPAGMVYQAGTLSGNPVAMAAGAATLRQLRETNPYPELERHTTELVSKISDVAKEARFPVIINRAGSMFTIFCTNTLVHNFRDVQKSDTERFGRLFHALLSEGVYFPPSQFEACFVSSAHGEDDRKHTIRAFTRAIEKISR